MKPLLFALSLLPAAALAEPRFQDRADQLPIEHIYSGGWEHFVGGGVAVFDCNGDALPEIFAAGGENPARLFLNTSAAKGDLTFTLADIPNLTGVTGAYPLDINSDGYTDLGVLRPVDSAWQWIVDTNHDGATDIRVDFGIRGADEIMLGDFKDCPS